MEVPYSKMKQSMAKILAKSGFIDSVEFDKRRVSLLVKLKFIKRKPAMAGMKIISKPQLRVYVSKKEIPRVLGGLGTAIISTSRGLMTSQQARKQGLGGELICEVW